MTQTVEQYEELRQRYEELRERVEQLEQRAGILKPGTCQLFLGSGRYCQLQHGHEGRHQ